QRLGMTYDDFESCVKELPSAKFIDASMLLWKLRMRKSPSEIALIRRACQITGEARQRCFDRVRVGMNEMEVGRIFRESMIELDADDVAFVIVNSFLPFELDRSLKAGKLLYLDGGARLGGYCCDFSRL